MTSNYSADLVVEAGFGSGYSTPLAAVTWTDISQWVEFDRGIQRDLGRRDERSTAQANRVGITLDNADGRFTPDRASSPYYPNVVLNTPIRVRAQLASGGGFVTVFVGYVSQWNTSWPSSVSNQSEVELVAVSRSGRFNRAKKLPARAAASLIARPSLAGLWMCDDVAGSASAAEYSNGTPLAVDIASGGGGVVAFGVNGPSEDGPKAASVTSPSGQHAQLAGSITPSGADLTVLAFVNMGAVTVPFRLQVSPTADHDSPANVAANEAILDIDPDGGGLGATRVTLTTSTGTSAADSSIDVKDGGWHLIALRWSATTAEAVIDGVSQHSRSVGASAAAPVTVAAGLPSVPAGTPTVPGLSTIAFLTELVSLADLAALAGVMTTGVRTTSSRFAYIAQNLAGIPSAEVDASTSTVMMKDVETYRRALPDCLREVETAEGGVVYDEADGTLRLAARGDRYGTQPTLVLNAALQQLQGDFAPQLDDSALLNDLTVVGVNGTGRAVDETSRDVNGVASDELETLATDPLDPQYRADWEVGTRANPRNRAPQLSFELYDLSASDQAAALALTVGSVVKTDNLPDQAPASSMRWFVEGRTDLLGLESWRVVLNVSPLTPGVNDVLTLGVAGQNELGTAAGHVLGY